MEYKKDFLDEENIPDFALRPAKPASTFDPTIYDKLFENMRKSAEAATKEEEEPAAAEEPEAVAVPVEPAAVDEPVVAEIAGEPETVGEPSAAEITEEPAAVDETIALEVPAELEIIDEHEQETIPVAAEPAAVEPEEPEAVPVHLPKKPLPVETDGALDDQNMRKIKYTDFRNLSPVVIYIEAENLIDLRVSFAKLNFFSHFHDFRFAHCNIGKPDLILQELHFILFNIVKEIQLLVTILPHIYFYCRPHPELSLVDPLPLKRTNICAEGDDRIGFALYHAVFSEQYLRIQGNHDRFIRIIFRRIQCLNF